jgi:putative ABC transport system permease protein
VAELVVVAQPQAIQVVVVVKDFNFESLKSKVRPLVIRLTERASNLQIRYEGDVQAVVAGVEHQWKNLAPGEPLDYTFMDQDFDELFRSEMRLKNIFTVFSSLAIFIACLGLFALAAFTTEQRTKEIGVRKALGASSASLTLLLSREFTILVLIAIVPAMGLGWYVADWWSWIFTRRS